MRCCSLMTTRSTWRRRLRLRWVRSGAPGRHGARALLLVHHNQLPLDHDRQRDDIASDGGMPDVTRGHSRDGPMWRSVHFRVVCNGGAVGCAAMGMKGDPAVRLCVTCGQLKAADQFAPHRRKCVACQQAQPGRGDRPGRPRLPDPHAAARARARDHALRRLGLKHLDAYRELYRAERRAIPDNVPTDRARSLAVRRALRMLERQHRHRYKELYQQELKRARSQPHPRRPGRPPGAPDRLTIAPKTESTWRRDGAGHRPPREQGEGRGSEPNCRPSGNRPPSCSPKEWRPPRSPAGSASPGRPRSAGTPGGGKGAPRRCEAVGPAAIPRFPTANCPRSNRRCCRGRPPTDLRVTLGPSSGLGSWSTG
jgi:hypothetical protein